MASFESSVLLRHKKSKVFDFMKNRIGEVVVHLPDIAAIECQAREPLDDGGQRLTNLWIASAAVPAALTRVIRPEMLRWTDTALWDAAGARCSWSIEPHLWKDAIQCRGSTRFDEAMNGRGTRVRVQGELKFSSAHLPLLLRGPAMRLLESFICVLVPGNFAKMLKAVGTALSS